MPYDLESRLVVAVASSALFDLSESDRVFREQGLLAYKEHQREREDQVLARGVAFPFVKKLLDLNSIDPDTKPVEVILLSRNDADTGLRIFNAIEHYHLHIERAVFCGGRDPFAYIGPLNAKLFLSANEEDVRAAVAAGLAAGQVIPSQSAEEDATDHELRIAFDFDGVLADDSAERVYKEHSITGFMFHETLLKDTPHNPGPLKPLLEGIAALQKVEQLRRQSEPSYKSLIRTAIVTARSAPAHKRVIHSLRAWGLTVDELFFLGGVDKGRIMNTFRPHIFFDDQAGHLDATRHFVPSVHIPFGIANKRG